MNVISVENTNVNIEDSIKKDILIPCWVYKVPIVAKKNSELNFIEQTILELFELDSTLRDDSKRLSKMLGFYSEEKEKDKTNIIELILNKLKDIEKSSLLKNEEDINQEVVIYQFYQEAYTNSLLPIITQNIKPINIIKKYHFEKYDCTKIIFKQNIDDKKAIKAILNDTEEKRNSKLNITEIIKTIYTHNKQNYKGSYKIDYSNLNIDMIEKPELIYLHNKLYILKNNVKVINITNGFTNDFSTVFRKFYNNNYPNLLRILRQEASSEKEDEEEDNIDTPFANKIYNFPDISKIINFLEKDFIKVQDKDINEKSLIFNKNNIVKNLYEIMEKTFEIYTENLKNCKSIKNKELIHNIAFNIGFKTTDFEIKKYLSILLATNGPIFQTYITKAIFYKSKEVLELAKVDDKILFLFDKLLKFRNPIKHGSEDKDKILEKITIDELESYKKRVYKVISIVLKVRQKVVNQNELDNDNIAFTNAYLKLERRFPFDILNKMPQDVENSLVNINVCLTLNFEEYKEYIIKESIEQFYISFELIFRKIVSKLLDLDINKIIIKKDEVIDEIQKRVSIGASFTKVSESSFSSALNKGNGSIGAYIILYYYYNSNMDIEDIKLLENIMSIRGHNGPSSKMIDKISENEIKKIKKDSFNYIEKLIEEI